MNRPSLPLAISVFVVWLLLVGKADFASVLMALLLAVLLPLLVARLRIEPALMQRPAVALRLAAVVLWDIVLSNINVARLILGSESRLRPAYVWIPLDLTNIYGISALAGIITMTPGTVSVDLATDRRHLLVHFLDIDDPVEAVAQIKRRYEQPLREVFP